MKRSILTLIALWLALVVIGDMHLYGGLLGSTANAGVYWNLGQHNWCGFEYRGHVGFFCDVA